MYNGEKAVSYMRKMATGCHWRVGREIHYVRTDGSVFTLKPGVWYTGIPYTQGKKKRLYSLFRFKLNLFGGFLFLKKSLVGCDCSSAASFAWKKVNSQMPIFSTRKMYKDLCGPQRYFSHQDRYSLSDGQEGTKGLIAQNDLARMKAAYEGLQIGDGLLQYDKIEKKGHIMMVTQPMEQGTLKIIDQKGFGEGGSERDDTSWRVDFPYTFERLIEEGYVPIRLL